MKLPSIRIILRSIRAIISRIRFSVRKMMALVLVVAMLLGALNLMWKRNAYKKLAQFYRGREIRLVGAIRGEEARQAKFDELTDPEVVSGAIASLKASRARMPYFRLLAEKYEHAASKPWLSVEPDPPEPFPVRRKPR